VRVAWLHNEVGTGTALLPGEFAGGGEMADAGMIAHAPEGVEVTTICADEWESALDFDRIVIAATDQLTPTACRTLAERKPLVWVHHQQAPSAARAHLFQQAAPFACMSRQHADLEAAWTGTSPVWNHGWVDPDDVAPGMKRHEALWAARNHPQKGKINARIWAQRNDVPLTELSDVTRPTVLAHMAHARWFVFLPKAFDSCPRTLLEAELAGCEIVTNKLTGRRDDGDLRDVLLSQPAKFWGWL
jgi:hypothetical protein